MAPCQSGAAVSASPGKTGGWPRELRRDLDQRLVDQHRDRVEVGGVGLQAEALGFQRDGAAAGERVEDRRRVAVGGLQDLLRAPRRGASSSLEFSHTTSSLDEARAAARARPSLSLLGGELVGVRRRGRRPAGRTARPGGGQRPARPPQVQCRRVAVADRLLPRGLLVDRLQRQRDLDQLALASHGPLRQRHRCVVARSSAGLHGAMRPGLAQSTRSPVASKSPRSTPPNGSAR